MKFVNVGNALKVTCVGFAAGVILRVVQMLYFFDYDTGFYTDGGVAAWISLGVPAAAGLLAAWMCFRSRRAFGPYVSRPNGWAGAASLLSGVLLLVSGAAQAWELRGSAPEAYRVLHPLFVVCCFLFGLTQLWAAWGFFRGKTLWRKAPLLYLLGTLWGAFYVILVYVYYARSSSLVENLFAVLGGVCTLLALFYLCKLLSGVDEAGAAKRLFVTGIFAVVLQFTYTCSNLALFLLGCTYLGEIPPAMQLGAMGVALFLLVFLVTFRKYSLVRSPKDAAEPSPRRYRSS